MVAGLNTRLALVSGGSGAREYGVCCAHGAPTYGGRCGLRSWGRCLPVCNEHRRVRRVRPPGCHLQIDMLTCLVASLTRRQGRAPSEVPAGAAPHSSHLSTGPLQGAPLSLQVMSGLKRRWIGVANLSSTAHSNRFDGSCPVPLYTTRTPWAPQIEALRLRTHCPSTLPSLSSVAGSNL